MQNKRKLELFEKDRERWHEKQNRITDNHELYNRTYFGSPIVSGIIIFGIILVVIILGIFK